MRFKPAFPGDTPFAAACRQGMDVMGIKHGLTPVHPRLAARLWTCVELSPRLEHLAQLGRWAQFRLWVIKNRPCFNVSDL